MFHLILYYPPIIWSPFTELDGNMVQGTFPGDFPCQPTSEIQYWIGNFLKLDGKTVENIGCCTWITWEKEKNTRLLTS